MHLIQILLPLYDNERRRFPRAMYDAVRTELTERFGGLTAHTRAPAEGLWAEEGEQPSRDDIVIFEVMADRTDRSWWRDYRKTLEREFRQDSLIIRAQEIELL